MVSEPKNTGEGPGRPLSACGAFKASASLPHIAEWVTGTVPITGLACRSWEIGGVTYKSSM